MASSVESLEIPLVVVAGPTASGKTGLAVRLAKQFGGEVISADSRAVYRGLTIGTAKPSPEEQKDVPHWGIDLAEPGERFTAADFKEYALNKVDEIRARERIPIIVGGTGLYIDAVLYDFEFPDTANDVDRREELMSKTLEELYRHCTVHNIRLPENSKNKRYVVNSILRNGVTPKRKHKLRDNTIVVGISTEKVILRRRIELRADTIVTPEVIDEALLVAKRYGWESEAMTGNIYPLVRQYLNGEITRLELKQHFIAKDWQLAKRQLTWLRRNQDMRWLSLEEAHTYIARKLEKLNNL